MKFRGKILDLISIRKFYNLLGTFAKLSRQCVLRLTEDKIYFILTEVPGNLATYLGQSPAVWCEMEQTHFFAEYTMQGVKPEVPSENQIFLELEPDRLAKTLNALKSSNSARSLKIKLTRKHDSPCLSFEIDLAPSTSMSTVSSTTSINSFAVSRTCTHDVPVTLIPRRHWQDFREPDMPAFDVSITMPDLKQMKHLMERYKNLGQHLTIQANREGKLQLKFESNQLSVVTHYKDLDNPARGNSHASQENSSDHFVGVRVDLKRFNQFLALEQVGPRKAIANLEEGRVVHMFLVHDDVVIQCFVPAVSD